MTTMDLIGKLLQAVLGLAVFGGLIALILVFLDRESTRFRGPLVRLIAGAVALLLGILAATGVLAEVGWITPALVNAATIVLIPLGIALIGAAALMFAPANLARHGRLALFVLAAAAIVIAAVVIESTGTMIGAWPWAAAGAISVCAMLGFLSTRHEDSRPMMLFLAPAALLLTIGLLYPAVRTTMLAFTDRTGTFNGFDNFVWMFTQQQALITLANTVVWVILVPLASTAIGLAYAVFIDKSRGERVYKMLVFMPMAISFVGAGIIWRFMYAYRGGEQTQIGLINQLIVWFGGEPQQILQNSPWNTLALVVVMIWIQTGFAMTVLSAAIKGVAVEQLEAASLDGANPWQRFANVTLPGIRTSVVVVVTTISIATLKVFDIVRTMTAGNFNTSVVANEMYTQAFRAGEPGRGAALALVLFLLVLPIVIYNIRILKQQKEIR